METIKQHPEALSPNVATLEAGSNDTPQALEMDARGKHHGKQRPKNLLGLIGIEEASEMLGIAPATMYNYTKKRAVPHYKLSNRLLYFDLEELKEWVRGYRVKTRDELRLEAEQVRAIAQPRRGRGGGGGTSFLERRRGRG